MVRVKAMGSPNGQDTRHRPNKLLKNRFFRKFWKNSSFRATFDVKFIYFCQGKFGYGFHFHLQAARRPVPPREIHISWKLTSPAPIRTPAAKGGWKYGQKTKNWEFRPFWTQLINEKIAFRSPFSVRAL